MWMDVANEVEQPEPEEDEDTVYDRNDSEEGYKRNPFPTTFNEFHERRGMLDEDGDTRCGIWSWRPDFLQDFVTPNAFICVFVLSALLHGTSWAYYTVSLSTMEKRLKISSETTGALLAGSEIAQVALSIVFSYFTIQKRRMKFITTGAALWALSCFILASHQMFFGSGKYALSMTKLEGGDIPVPVDETSTVSGVDSGLLSHPIGESGLVYSTDNDRMMSIAQLCTRDAEFINASAVDCPMSDSGSSLPVSFVLISQLLSGLGTVLFLSSGAPYIEDVVMPNQIPVLFGITLSLRLIGPFVGYVIGSAFLRIFISPYATPTINEFDPRWMGAWWLGWLVIAILMLFSTLAMSLFPAQMAKDLLKKRSLATDTGPPFLTSSAAVTVNSAELRVANPLPGTNSFLSSLILIFNNNVILFITLSTIFHLFVGTGYWTFFPKYLEVVFHEPAAKAAVLAGSLTVTFNAAGLLISGIVISKTLPSSNQLTFWSSFVAVTQVVIFIIITQFGCDSGELLLGAPQDDASSFSPTTLTTYAATTSTSLSTTTTPILTSVEALLSSDQDGSFASTMGSTTTTAEPKKKNFVHLMSNCSTHCACRMGPMTPVCEEESGHAYYSPCHAGCPNPSINGTFTNCSCASSEDSVLVKGFCPQHGGCFTGLVTLMIFTAMSQFLGSSCVVGKMLLFYRTTEPETRSLVISVGVLLISILGIIPGPIIFGTIIDAACHIWERTCNGTFGHCWHYHNTSLRYGLNLTASGFLLCGAVFDVLLWRKVKVKDVRLYDGDVDIPKPSSSGQAFGHPPGNSRAIPSYS